jgi:hypothetical protein
LQADIAFGRLAAVVREDLDFVSDFAYPQPVVEQPAKAPRNKSIAKGNFFVANVVTVRF